jgi:aspartate-semialdehyde dehydrogenase
MEELASQTIALLNMQEVKREVFAQQIAFNVLPQVDAEEENGYTHSEMKMLRASQKILADKDMVVNATILQAPVFFGHSQAVQVETGAKLGAEEARELLRQAPGVKVSGPDETGHYPTAVTDAAGQDAVFVGRIREDIADQYGLNLWLVADNVRRGAALNCVQIIELLVKDDL